MALIGAVGALCALAVIAAGPQAGDPAGFVVGEDARTVHDARRTRIRHRDLDHVDGEQGGVLIARQPLHAAFQLFGRAHRAGAGIVDHDPLVIAGHDRMGVRTPAGLHLAHLTRRARIGDVENAQPAEALLAHLLVNALASAIDARARVLDRQQEQIAHDGRIALPARTHDRADQPGRLPFDIVEIEAVIIAHRHEVAGEGEVGVGEAQEGRALAIAAPRRILVLFALFSLRFGLVGRQFRRQAGRILRVEKAGGLGQAGHELEIGDRLLSVAEAAREAGARIAGQVGERIVHAADLGALFAAHVVDEIEQERIVSRAARVQEIVHHLHRAFMVRDHQLEEETIEGEAFGRFQLRHFFRRRHPDHALMAAMMHGVRIGRRIGRLLAALQKPAAHEGDFVGLGGVDAVGGGRDRAGIGARLDQPGHLNRLEMVQDHRLHEAHVGLRVPIVGDLDRLFRGERARRFARRARLDDGRILSRRHPGGQRRQGRTENEPSLHSHVSLPTLQSRGD